MWVPFWADDKCREAGLATGIDEKVRRFGLLLDAYGREFGSPVVRAGIDRTQDFLDDLQELAAVGSAWELEMSRRGVLEELARDIAWTEQHAEALVRS